jgi:glycosyltransferase involved in cell wall biosynthesis
VTAVTRIPMRLRASGPRSGSRTLARGLRCGGTVSADIVGDDPDLGVAGRPRRCAVPTRRPMSAHPAGAVIWIVNQYAGSPRHGMEYRHYHFARGLIERGHRVVVISGSRSHLFIRPPQVSRPFTLEPIDGVTYCWVAVPRYERAISLRRVLNMAAFALRLERLPVQRLPRPDAILVSSPSLFPVPIAARWARRFGARLVFEVCDIWPLTLRELGGLSRGHPLVMAMQWLEDYGYRKADSVVSVLPAATRHMVSRGMDPRKFHYIPNGIDLAGRRAGGRAPDVVRAAIRPGTFTVGFVGTLGRANALETLIDAARLLDPDEAQVILVGQGPEREQLVTRAAGAPNVAFTAAVLEEHVGPAIALFDACYVGYRRSPLYRFGVSPNKLYEYMAAGRPVLFAADAANQPVQEADCGRTVAPEDPAALAAAIRSLAARSQEERDRLGANARAYVARHHDYARLAEELADILMGDER